MIKTATVTDGESFRRLRGEWTELLASSPSDTVFLTWEWLHTWWEHCAGPRRLALLAVRDGKDLIALAPLAVRPPQSSRLSFTRRLEFLGTGAAGSDYLDLIVREGEEDRAVPAIEEALERVDAAIDLAQTRAGALAERLAGSLQQRGWWLRRTVTNACPFIPLSGLSWSSYLQGLGPSHRANLNRRVRTLTRDHDVAFEAAGTEPERRRAFEALVALHNARRAELGSDAFDRPGRVAFHDRFSALALEQGWLRLFVLRLDGQPVASLYGLRYRDVFSFYQSGFDPSWAHLSVGLVTMGWSIRQAIDEGASEFDFLHGEESYKSLWTQTRRPLGRLEIYPPRAAGALARRMDDAGRGARRLARALLPGGSAARIARGLNARAEGRPDAP
ncbi:MAG TPA: GNAT family N-acetyltransferase [Candidatus Polarisedimenticolia bacterium]|nr:GNAT family N-acetyltransferase [Candidatus Polarisedimenticolia bacterium]